MNVIDDKNSIELEKNEKTCAGRDCPEKAVISLRLWHIRKEAAFCVSCAAFLVANDLVEEGVP
jgi:hypothetical protein